MQGGKTFNAQRRHILKVGLVGGTTALVLQTGCSSQVFTRNSRADNTPSNLMVSLRNEAFGVDVKSLRFTWIPPASQTDAVQVASRIQIASSTSVFEREENVVWDSGKVSSNNSVAVTLDEQAELKPDEVYFWRVKTWYEHSESSWSAPQMFITSIASDGWRAKPIWVSTTRKNAEWACFRKSFNVESSSIEHAWLRVSAGSTAPSRQYVYKCWINGVLQGVGPVRPMADEHRYHTYDVGHLLRAGQNAISAQCFSIAEQFFSSELVIKYKNGTRQEIYTGDDWQAFEPSKWLPESGTFTDMYYHGANEYIDAREEPVGWQLPGFKDAWADASVMPLELSNMAPALVDESKLEPQLPKKITAIGKHRWVIDFGREVVGGVRVNCVGRKGQTLEVRLGEELNDDGSVRYKLRAFPVYRDIWTLREGQQVLEHWGYRAFRWVEVISSDSFDVASALVANVFEMPWDATQSAFSSSNDALNKVWGLCHYSIKATRQDLYQDTPTRERGPYEGDAIINQLSEYYTQRSFALAKYSISYLIRNPTWPTEYRLLTSTLTWQDYLHSGDISRLEEDFPLIVENQLFDHINPVGLIEKPPGQASHPNGDLVDWPMSNRDQFEFTSINTVVNCWQYASLVALTSIARVLNRTDDEKRFNDMAVRLKKGINQYLFDTTRHLFRDGLETDHCSQHASIFAVSLGAVEERYLPLVGAAIADDVRQRGVQVSAYAAQFLLEALYQTGYQQLALDVLTSTERFSWLNMIDRHDATIVMEAWDPDIKPNTTFSHAWGSAPANIVPRFIAGVRVLSPGASHIAIAPSPASLQQFSATVPTVRGVVLVSYRGTNGAQMLTLSIPPNMTATVDLTHLPWKAEQTVSVQHNETGEISSNQNITKSFTLVSGNYVISPNA